VLTIRAALAHELPAVADLTVAAYLADDLVGEEGYVEQLRATVQRAEQALLLVAVDASGELAGTVTYCAAGSRWAEIAGEDEAEFRMLAVASHARGRGVARQLIAACDDQAAADGKSTLALSVIRHNAKAQRLYEALGFTRSPQRDWYPLPGVKLLVWTRPVTVTRSTTPSDRSDPPSERSPL
jgi:ribosomal protein S18 acetylase RimI-like enzyme